MTTLYERLGGAEAVSAAVELFYARTLSDSRINGFFDDVDMSSQKSKMKKFLSMVTGGPALYAGLDMRAGHAHLELGDPEFDAVVENLGLTLSELGVAAEDIAACAVIAESVRDDVLNRSPQGSTSS